MNKVNIKVIVNGISADPRSDQRPCPRINVFEHPFVPESDITSSGEYTFSFDLKSGRRVGVDVFTWRDKFVEVSVSNGSPISEYDAGLRSDQRIKKVNFTEPGDYIVTVNYL